MRRDAVIPIIIGAIADVEGCSPHDLDFTLYDHVDTNALRSLCASDQTDWKLTFEVPDHTVLVRGTGEVRVDGEPVRTVANSHK
ncbi:MAG: HalOD1 output domain-containing protein [Halobacteriaceae archaeon]